MYTVPDLAKAITDRDLARVETILGEDPTLVDGRTAEGISMLTLAQYQGSADLVKTLVMHNAQIDIYDACAIGDAARAMGWLAMQPNLANSFSPDGFTPLGLAAFFGHLEIVNTLLMYHADPNTASNNAARVAPLHSAVAGDHYEIATKLIEAGANVNAVQADGFTPLMGAAQNGNLEMARLLVNHSADVTTRTDKGSSRFPDATALTLARQANAGEVMRFLELVGAKT